MAASAWQFYNSFREYMGDGTIDLDTSVFKIGLYTSAASPADDTLSVRGSLSNEVANANNYVTGGQSLLSITWAAGASAGVMRFDSDDPLWTASGGTISNIKYAVIYQSGASANAQKLVCRTTLTSDAFSVTDTNTLTITLNASGIFELT